MPKIKTPTKKPVTANAKIVGAMLQAHHERLAALEDMPRLLNEQGKKIRNLETGLSCHHDRLLLLEQDQCGSPKRSTDGDDKFPIGAVVRLGFSTDCLLTKTGNIRFDAPLPIAGSMSRKVLLQDSPPKIVAPDLDTYLDMRPRKSVEYLRELFRLEAEHNA